MDKKGQGLSLNTIIIAAIVLIVLIVLWAIFTGKMGGFSTGISEEDAKARASSQRISDLARDMPCVNKESTTCTAITTDSECGGGNGVPGCAWVANSAGKGGSCTNSPAPKCSGADKNKCAGAGYKLVCDVNNAAP